MILKYLRDSVVLVSLLLGACGGGGGSEGAVNRHENNQGNNTTPTPPPPVANATTPPPINQNSNSSNTSLTISPSTLTAIWQQGTQTPIRTLIKPNSPPDGTLQVKVEDRTGKFQPYIALSGNGDGSYTAEISGASQLAPGKYTGIFLITICTGNPCASVPGSPFELPFDFTVTAPPPIIPTPVPTPTLSDLRPLAGARDWETFQGSATHTGYVPITVDPKNFSFRWKWTTSEWLSQIATTDNKVFFVAGGKKLIAISEKDSSLVWSNDHSNNKSFYAASPAAKNGLVYFVAKNTSAPTLYSVMANTGKEHFRSEPIGGEIMYFNAPTIDENSVYPVVPAISHSSLASLNKENGNKNWHIPATNMFGNWAASFDEKFAYFLLYDSIDHKTSITIIDKFNGQLHRKIPFYNNIDSTMGDIQSAPILAGEELVLVYAPGNNNELMAFDVKNSKMLWSKKGNYTSGSPAYANGVIYLMDNLEGVLEARTAKTGEILWKWNNSDAIGSDGSRFSSSVVVVNNLVFISTKQHIYALDNKTGKVVWKKNDLAGSLAISANGILYINSWGHLTAFNLH